MDFDFDALQELAPQEQQTVGICNQSCRPTYCTATCTITDP
ncbi:ALQxL family class IV lanthipeptide [Kitasatospora azatica]|nr:ALQxL family class IV lanthipeptide [Kitasatospora azatica]